ncbi:MAG: GldG family protein, partial [Clostridiales bacterium]|nr:GldG family protein [Clostridiales bacterium]
MDYSWLSLVFSSLFWFCAFPVYEDSRIWAVPYLAAAFALAALPDWTRRKSLIRAGYAGLVQNVAALLPQGIVFPFCYLLFAKYHAESVVIRAVAPILNLFGVSAVIDGTTLRFDSARAPVDFAATWEKSGVFLFLLIFVGGAALLALRRARGRRYLLFAALTAGCLVLRYAALLFIYIQYPLHGIFWDRVFTLVSLLPYGFLLSFVFRADRQGLPEPPRLFNDPPRSPQDPPQRSHGLPRLTAMFPAMRSMLFPTGTFSRLSGFAALAVAASAVFALSCTAFFGFHDPGREKAGRVLVDEYHSNWEWTDEAYDESWFGERSGYNYYCFYEYIGKFYETRRNTGRITPETLSETDVLILKTPTEPYDDAEIAAVTAFVEGGGGLYMLGDHTNVFGTDANLNQIAARFGLRFRYDCTYELTSGSLSEYEAPALLPHPVVSHLPHFLFATSDTLETGWLTEDVIVGYGLKNLPADYSQLNFFPADTNTGAVEFGAFIQCAALPYGKGRVLAFTDSTVFSNFWMHMKGKPELLLGSLEWLNRENVLPIPPRAVASALMLISACLLALVFVLR